MKRFALFVIVALLFGAGVARDAFDDWIDATNLPNTLFETSREVRDRNGDLLRAYTVDNGLWRLAVSVDKVDPDFIKMLLAYEDKRFWQHNGIDGWAMMRAAVQALRNGQIISGGSTLTMQVARMLEDSGTGAWRGKLRQMRVALALERHYDKADILNLYLAQAPYGGNIEGIRAATLAYFGKEPTRLTPAESALLVALPQAPTARRPDQHPKIAQAARNRVLARMVGNGGLSVEANIAARSEVVPSRKRAFPALAPHLADRAIASAPEQQRHVVTLDATLQKKLETLAAKTVGDATNRLSIAIVVADHQSGEILASVGSAGYNDADQRRGFVDMTRAVRSPGSTLKPLIYGMAFDAGLVHPNSLIDDRPIAFGSYAPQNFDGRFRGEIRVVEALQLSLNIPVVMLTQEIGPLRLMASLRRAGIAPKLAGDVPGLAIALGGIGMTLEDLVQLYAMLASGGKSIPLHWTTGETAIPQSVISRSSAWQVGQILSGIAPPIGAPMNRLAYKTGTSYGHRDAWAIGFDGRHVAGVWIGRADGTPVPGAFGGELAAPVLFEAFQRLKPELEDLSPPPPEALLVSTANLPQPLQRFRSRTAVFEDMPDGPALAFPPNGALVSLEGAPLSAKVRNGKPPFTWLANGHPVLVADHAREVALPGLGQGFNKLSVIDALGRAARISIEIR